MWEPYENSYVIHTVNEVIPLHDVKCHTFHLFSFVQSRQCLFLTSPVGAVFFFPKHWFLTVITPLESPSSAWYFTEAEDGYVSGTYTILRVRFITQPCFGAYNLSAKSLEPSVL